jgi:hypothetical protein
MEKKIEVRTFKIYKYCECGGKMNFLGIVLTTWPAKYPHECELCKKKATYDVKYPFLEHEEVNLLDTSKYE